MKELLFNSALIALGSASFSVFLEFCLRSGNVLGWWGDFVNRDFENKLNSYLAKPFGACIYCFGAWVFIGLFLVTYTPYCAFISSFLGLIAGLGFNHIFILILTKIEDAF